MNPFTVLLYVNALLFYVICFACPMIFVNPCGKGINSESHYIYAIYSVINAATEIVLVVRIQNKIGNKDILRLNKWHFVELFMG